jgi:PmbA protein
VTRVSTARSGRSAKAAKVGKARTSKAKTKAKASKPKASKPKASKTKAAKTKAAKTKAAKPKAAKPKASKPKAAKTKASKPKASKPKAAKTKASKPKASKPKASKTKVSKPKAVKTKVSKPKASNATGQKTRQRPHDRLRRCAEHALETLCRLGVDHAEVSVGTGNELEVGVRKGDIELVKEAQSSGMSVRVMRDGRVATSSTTALEPEAVEAWLATVIDMAEVSEPDELAAPPDPRELCRSHPELDLFDAATDRIKAERGIKLALRAEKAAFAADDRIVTTEGSSFSRTSGHSVLATTGGFVGEKRGTYQSLVVQAVADDEGGKKRNGVYWTGARFFEDLEGPVDVGREAARRAIETLGTSKMETGVYPVVFDKEAARAIIALVASCVLGDGVYRERSYLAKELGKSIGSKHVTLVDDPLIDRGPGSRAFDGEGRKVGRLVVVDKGVLQTFLLDTYSARRLKMKPTGSASGGGGIPHASTSNFFLRPGRGRPQTLLQGIERGLYVTKMMGFGFDPTTGTFSRGAEGFLIENGELTRPVGEITISRNLGELLAGIDEVADDLEHKTSIAAPSFRVDQMTIAGQ